ncbi:DUF2203 domain-containing protein [Phycisphaerales bacterium AB-hyl4]|uniref:DUF2203 domain-containing protein n=1 Tax=Natronomicrosphaera hydrolytica TaxID=3242702 RepID=A0ABV4U976_9BACT
MTTTHHDPFPDKRYFSVEEANRALPYVQRIVKDVAEVYSRIVDLRREVEQAADTGGDSETAEARYETAMDRLSALVDELHAVGVELKDFEKGLIDFPAVHDGREVQLCWHPGEPEVGYWHETDAGYAGRQSVDTLENVKTAADDED